jgi:glycerophosphoryl diester phosphodiesterase
MEKTARFLNIGHRGAAAYAKENTIASFEEAIIRHADMIEFDVRRTSDGVLVVFHDRTIKTAWGRSPVSRLTFQSVQEAARVYGFTVARFIDVVKRFGDRISMNIEIKARGFEHEVVEILTKHPIAFQPVLSSFFPWVVGRVNALESSINTGLIIGKEQTYRFGFLGKPVIKPLAHNLGIASMHLQESIIDSRIPNRIHDLGLKIYAWTVDDEDRMRELVGLGVDGIITNRPDVLNAVCLELAVGKKSVFRKVSSGVGRFAYTH